MPKLMFKHFCMSELLIAPKILYFFIFAYVRAIILVRCQFFRDVYHMTTSDYARMLAIYSFIQFLTAPMWAFLVDKYRRPKAFVLGLSIIGVISYSFYKVVPPRIYPSDPTFALLLLVSIFVTGFTSILIPLMDRICLSILMNTKGVSKEMYGRQRLFGCFGDIAATYIVSYFADQSYDNLYISVGVTEVLLIISGFFLIPSDSKAIKEMKESDEEANAKKSTSSATKSDEKISRMKKFTSSMSNLSKLLTNVSFMFFLMIALLNGVCKSFGANFLSNFFEDKFDGLSATKTQIATISTVGYIFEISGFFCSKWLLEKFGSFMLLTAAQVTMIGRFAIHSSLPVGTSQQWPIWLAICGEVLKGLNLGLMQAAGVMIASKEAPPELQATAQGFFAGVYQGLAPTLSGFIGAIVIRGEVQKLPGETDEQKNERRRQLLASRTGFFDDNRGMFRIAALFALVALILLLGKIFRDRRRPKSSEESSEDVPPSDLKPVKPSDVITKSLEDIKEPEPVQCRKNCH